LTIIKKFTASFILRLFAAAISYLTFFALARLLNKEEFGYFNIITTWINIFIIFGGFGLGEVLKYEYRIGSLNQREIFSCIYSFGLTSSFIVLALTFFFIKYFINNDALIWYSIPIIYFLNFNSELYYAHCLSIDNGDRGVIFYYLVRQFVFLFSIISLFLLGISNLNYFLIFFIFSYLLNFIYINIFTEKNIKINHIRKYFSLNWKHGIFNALTIGSSTIILSLDSILLSFYTTPNSVAEYNFAFKLAQIPSFILLVLNPSVTGWIISKSSKDFMITKNYLHKYSLFALIFCCISGLFIMGTWNYIISIIGKDYIGVFPIYCILFLFKIIESYFSFYGTYINIYGYSLWMLKCSVVMIIINITVNLLLIPTLAAIGAAIATTMTMSIFYILLYYKFTTITTQSIKVT